MRLSLLAATLVLLALFLTAPVGAQAARPTADEYWDDIELIDGQVLHGVILDTVKEKVIIQLTTKDVISLPQASVRKVIKAGEKAKIAATEAKAAAQLELPVILDNRSSVWDFAWFQETREPTARVKIELVDGTLLDGVWIDTKEGRALVDNGDGTVTSVLRSSIRRVVGASTPAPNVPVVDSSPAAVDLEPRADLLGPVFASIGDAWSGLNSGPVPAAGLGSKTFFLPTASTMPAGRFTVASDEVVLADASYGITDSVQLRVGLFLPPVLGFAAPYGVGASLAVSTQVMELEGLKARVAALTGFGSATAGYAGAAGLVGTLEGPLGQFSLGGGAAMPLGMGLSPVGLTAASQTLWFAPHWALQSEVVGVWELNPRPRHHFTGITGLRFASGGLFVDAGAALAATMGRRFIRDYRYKRDVLDYNSAIHFDGAVPVINVGYEF